MLPVALARTGIRLDRQSRHPTSPPRSPGGEGVGDAGVARVVEMEPERSAGRGAATFAINVSTANGSATPIVSPSAISNAPGSASRASETTRSCATSPSNGHRTHRNRQPGTHALSLAISIALAKLCHCLGNRGVLVALVEALRRANDEIDLVHLAGQRPLKPTFVERQPD